MAGIGQRPASTRASSDREPGVARADHGGAARPRPPPALPWQFAIRAVAILAGLTLLFGLDVRGLASYVAWMLIALALLSEVVATVVYWRRTRRAAQ